jgi:hypothetical protein
VRVLGARRTGKNALEVVRALPPLKAALALKRPGIELRAPDADPDLEWVVLVEDPERRRVLGVARLARVTTAAGSPAERL